MLKQKYDIEDAVFQLETFRENNKNVSCNTVIPKFSLKLKECAAKANISAENLFLKYMNFIK